ncbi:MAG TPA: hypothetical protein VF175_02470, partial [Lacipirellula sp.]
MQSFRQRPLVWLFLIATACVDLILATHSKSEQHDALEGPLLGVFIGQIWLAGAWLVLGEAHRLARGAGFVLAMLGLTTIIAMSQDGLSMSAADWGESLPAITVMGAAAALAAGGASFTLRAVSQSDRHGSGGVRFPIVELFGWTIVVAVASWASTAGEFSKLLRVPQSFIFAVSSSITAGVAAALATAQRGDASWLWKALPAAVVVGFVVIVALLGGVRERDLYHGVHWALGYMGLFALVGRLHRGGA